MTTAGSFFNESLELQRNRGDQVGIALVLAWLGDLAFYASDLASARSHLEKSLAIFQEPGHPWATPWGTAGVLFRLARTLLGQGDVSGARPLFVEALQLLRRLLANRLRFVECLEGVAGVAVAERRLVEAVRLFGLAAAEREVMGAPLPPIARVPHERQVDAARAALGDAAFGVAWEEGRATTVDQAIEDALRETA